MTPQQYVESGKHLPEFLKDFHDQKDVFKTIQRMYGDDPEKKHVDMPNWVQSHCYVIDWFLWWLGQRGWTLQRSRADVEFRDVSEDVSAAKKQAGDEFFAALDARKDE